MSKRNHLVVGLAAALVSGSSLAGSVTYEVYFPPTVAQADINGSMGADTARSFMGASRMSIQAFRNVTPPDENAILNSCKVYSSSPNYWPESCNPDGMRNALNNGGWGSWISSMYNSGDQASALNQQVGTLKYHRSPNIVPIYGQGDHWVMVHRMVVDDVSGNVIGVVFRDGGPGGDWDSSFNSYDDGQRSASGATWSTTYFRVLTSIGPADPYYNKYVVLWDPPTNAPPAAQEHYRAQRPKSPVAPGQKLSPQLVRKNAVEALRLGGLDVTDAGMWSILSQANPGLPYEVQGVYPDGSDWNYYLVPFYGTGHMMVGMAMLDMADASYQQAWVLPEPRRVPGHDRAQARGLAHSQSSLQGDETLDEGMLTWDPTAEGAISRSPMRPFYEFQVRGPNGEDRGAVAVRLDTGSVHRVSPCQVSRRARSWSCAQ